MIDLLKEEWVAIINHAVTKGIDPDVEMKDSGIEWLGEVPKHWGVKKLKYFLDLIVDNRGRTPKFDVVGDIPMLEVKQITLGGRYPSTEFDKFVEKSIADEFVREHIKEGDILLSTVGATAGKVNHRV